MEKAIMDTDEHKNKSKESVLSENAIKQKRDKGTPAKIICLDSEVNLLKYPFFALSRKDARHKIETEYQEVEITPSGKIEKYWQVTANAKYGYPGFFDRKVFRAIESIISELQKPISNPIPFSLHELCKRMGINTSGVNKANIKEAIIRIIATTVRAKGSYYSKEDKKYFSDKLFHLYDTVIFYGEKMPDGETADKNYIFLNELYLNSINSFYVRPLDYQYLISLNSSISERLYEILGIKFYGIPKNKPVRYLYSTLCDLLPVTRQRYLSKAKGYLTPSFEKLTETGFFDCEPVWENTSKKDDWYIFFNPGKRVRTEKARNVQAAFDFGKPVSLPLPKESIDYEAVRTKPSSKGSECVLYFYRKLYENDEFNHDPTEKEVELAEKYLNEVGEDALCDIIDETIDHARRTNWEIRSFCSIKVIAPKKLSDLLNKRREDRIKESENNEMQLIMAYNEFVNNEVVEYLNQLPKNELDQIIEEEESKVIAHWGNFANAKKVSDVPAMEQEFEFNLENRVKEMIKIITFEEWKNKLKR